MALTPTETQQLATLAQDVTRLNGTADDLLSLVRTAGQGGAVDISTHNNNAAAHAALFANYTYLTANTTYYLSATGNDANDGTTAAKAKGTWAGMHGLLASIDPRGYTVTVKVSGMIPGDTTFALPQFGPHNCNLVGTSTATDGFTGIVMARAGGFQPDKISFGCLSAQETGNIYANGKAIRLAASGGVGLNMPAGNGQMSFKACTIEYAGSFSALALIYGGTLWLRQNAFTAIDNPTLGAVLNAGQGGRIVGTGNTWTGGATVTGTSINLSWGSEISIGISSAMPGGGGIARSGPGDINAYGAAYAYARVAGAGTITNSYGVLSVTKNATGKYTVATNRAPAAVSLCIESGSGRLAAYSITGNDVGVTTSAIDGTLADFGFSVLIF